jgi:hypothetical protein
VSIDHRLRPRLAPHQGRGHLNHGSPVAHALTATCLARGQRVGSATGHDACELDRGGRGGAGRGLAWRRGGGRFALNLNGNRNHRIDIHGRVSGKTISGTITDRIASWIFTDNHRQKLSCRAGTERYTAHAP